MIQRFSTIQGKPVVIHKHPSILDEHYESALQCQKFINWTNNFNESKVDVRSVTMLSLYMFGKNIGFINVEVEAYLNGIRLPGYVFIRGAAVAVLLLLNGKMALTRQFRVPVGKFTLETPAGMVDESKHFVGIAAKELHEECGIEIDHSEMKQLGSIMVSPGGCDEEITLFVVEKTIDNEKLEEILNKVHGESSEGEQITLELLDFTWANILQTQDVKLISAAGFYFEQQKKLI